MPFHGTHYTIKKNDWMRQTILLYLKRRVTIAFGDSMICRGDGASPSCATSLENYNLKPEKALTLSIMEPMLRTTARLRRSSAAPGIPEK